MSQHLQIVVLAWNELCVHDPRRIDRLPVGTDFKMKMRSRRSSARANCADERTRWHLFPFLDSNRFQVGIPGLEPEAVIDKHNQTVPIIPACLDHNTGSSSSDI